MNRLIAAALAAFFVSACQTTEPVAAACPEFHVSSSEFYAHAERGNATLAHTYRPEAAARIVAYINNSEPKTDFQPDSVVVFDNGSYAAVAFLYDDIDCVYTNGFAPVPVVKQWLHGIFSGVEA